MMIQLTNVKDRPVFVRTDRIVAVQQAKDFTIVHYETCDGLSVGEVQETADRVYRRIMAEYKTREIR